MAHVLKARRDRRAHRRLVATNLAVATAALAVPLCLFGTAATPAAASTVCTPVSFSNCARYGYTGADQTFSVPAGVSSLSLKVWGAGGASGGVEAKGGGGGFTEGTLAVTAGQTLTITVGQAGQVNSTTGTYGGGGRGGIADSGTENARDGGSGGGMSAIWATSYGVGPLLIAGGGGAGTIDTSRNAGGGGGTTGGAGSNVASGGGATQSAGGAAGNNGCGEGDTGGMYSGGAGGDGYRGGGGAGGGYFGGGGGDCVPTIGSFVFTGAGGGGSGYKNGAGVSGATSSAAFNQDSAGNADGFHTSGIGDSDGNGMVVIQWSGAPTASPLTSSGPFGLPQTATATIPDGGSVTLLDSGSAPATTVTVAPSQGTYTINTGTGVITFTPVSGFSGTATPVTYKLIANGLPATSTYTPTVGPDPDPGPTAAPLTSTGVGTTPQTATATVPGGGSVTLLGTGGQPATTVTVPGQGVYTRSGAVITFTPVKGYSGVATPAGYRLTDSGSRTADSTYTPTVTKPAPPNPVAKTSTGLGTAAQSVAVDVPAGASVTLLDNGTEVPAVTRSGEGTYGWDGTAGRLTFSPVAGFVGVAGAVTYRVTDAYAQHGDATYTATVTTPPPPDAPDRTTAGVGVTPQTATLPVPASGSISLIDADGNPTTSLFFPAKGTYTLTLVPAATSTGVSTATSTGVSTAAFAGASAAGTVPNPSQQAGSALVTFTPVLGFHGQLPPVPYQVTDAYGQTAHATYTPLVTIPGPPAPPAQHTTGPVDQTQTAHLTVPSGGSITLLDARRRPATMVRIPRQGTYILEPATGRISFVAVNGFTGQAKVVWYRVIDAYGQTAEATYAANVTPSTLAVTGLGLLGMILTGASMIPTGAALVALGSRRHSTATPITAAACG